jgi:hypothetical protein
MEMESVVLHITSTIDTSTIKIFELLDYYEWASLGRRYKIISSDQVSATCPRKGYENGG